MSGDAGDADACDGIAGMLVGQHRGLRLALASQEGKQAREDAATFMDVAQMQAFGVDEVIVV